MKLITETELRKALAQLEALEATIPQARALLKRKLAKMQASGQTRIGSPVAARREGLGKALESRMWLAQVYKHGLE